MIRKIATALIALLLVVHFVLLGFSIYRPFAELDAPFVEDVP